jgi:microcystin-dependent protein
MSDQFVAEIRMFGFNFAPTGWAFCNGQLMPISQNTALFSLLGTFYGGDGKSTFALPNLQGSAPVHQGQGQGLSERFLGEQSGTETVTLLVSEMPVHTHTAVGRLTLGNQQIPGPTTTWGGNSNAKQYINADPDKLMGPQALSIAGGGLPHNNLMSYLTVNFCIALQGVFPQRP